MDEILAEVKRLGNNMHIAGTVPNEVLEEFLAQSKRRPWRRTMETGCGRTTLLISHLSEKHTVFALGLHDDSVKKVFSSELLRREAVEFVAGSTQRTLPEYEFGEPFQLIFLDGPHAFPFPNLEYYHVYRHLEAGGLLVIDDICIPTVYQLFEFLREDPMFRLDKVVAHTAFFIRTEAPTFDPYGDGWPDQPYNSRRYPKNLSFLAAVKLAFRRGGRRFLTKLGIRKKS